MDKIIVNGKFMLQTVTGVQRYTREVLNELDKILPADCDIVLDDDMSWPWFN